MLRPKHPVDTLYTPTDMPAVYEYRSASPAVNDESAYQIKITSIHDEEVYLNGFGNVEVRPQNTGPDNVATFDDIYKACRRSLLFVHQGRHGYDRYICGNLSGKNLAKLREYLGARQVSMTGEFGTAWQGTIHSFIRIKM